MNKCLVTKVVCPKDDSCPWWWETVQENSQTNDVRILRECGIKQLPLYLTAVIQASNRPAAEVGAMRDELVAGLGRVAKSITSYTPPQLEN